MMPIFAKARKILTVDKFDKRRSLAARKLYHSAKGEEKRMIGQLFESQAALAKTPDDSDWLREIDKNYFT